MTKSEYEKIVADVVAAEQEQLCEALNAVFDREGHSQEALIKAFIQLVQNQPVVAAHVVSTILEQTGILLVFS